MSEQNGEREQAFVEEWIALLREFAASSYTRFGITPKSITIPPLTWVPLADKGMQMGTVRVGESTTVEIVTAYGVIKLVREGTP